MHPGKWPKSVKFSSWRDESDAQRYGPAGTVIQPGSASSWISGNSYRGVSIATQISPSASRQL